MATATRCLLDSCVCLSAVQALSCISTGVFGYPQDEAAFVAARAVREWLDVPGNSTDIDLIIFVVYTNPKMDDSWLCYQEALQEVFPRSCVGSGGADTLFPTTAHSSLRLLRSSVTGRL